MQASGSRRLQSEGKRAPHSYHQLAPELPHRTSELTAGTRRGGRTPSREGVEERSAWLGGLLSLYESWAPGEMWVLYRGGVLGDAIAADSPTTLWGL